MDNRHTALLTFTLFTFKMCHHVLAWPLLISNTLQIIFKTYN